MSVFDIRTGTVEDIEGVQFDAMPEAGVLKGDREELFIAGDGKEFELCRWEDFDNFIAACHKARELWGPKS